MLLNSSSDDFVRAVFIHPDAASIIITSSNSATGGTQMSCRQVQLSDIRRCQQSQQPGLHAMDHPTALSTRCNCKAQKGFSSGSLSALQQSYTQRTSQSEAISERRRSSLFQQPNQIEQLDLNQPESTTVFPTVTAPGMYASML